MLRRLVLLGLIIVLSIKVVYLSDRIHPVTFIYGLAQEYLLRQRVLMVMLHVYQRLDLVLSISIMWIVKIGFRSIVIVRVILYLFMAMDHLVNRAHIIFIVIVLLKLTSKKLMLKVVLIMVMLMHLLQVIWII